MARIARLLSDGPICGGSLGHFLNHGRHIAEIPIGIADETGAQGMAFRDGMSPPVRQDQNDAGIAERSLVLYGDNT